jgi:hypothetical protein
VSEETFSGGEIAAAAASATSAPEASPTSEPSTPADTASSEPVSEPAPATEVPESDGQPVSETQGEPPKERWSTILENARKKAVEETEAQYAWAKGTERAEFEAARTWMSLANRDPFLALDRLVQGMAQTPEGKQQLATYFGRSLSQSRQAAQPQAPEMPGPDIPTSESNGQPVVYSAQRMQELLQWQQQQLLQQVDQRISPFKQEREAKEREARTNAYTESAISRVKDRPGFTEHKEDIVRAYAAMPVVEGEDEAAKLMQAYLDVVGPKLTFQARQQAVADITRKASASTVNPAAVSGKSFDYSKATLEEALAYEWKKRGGK